MPNEKNLDKKQNKDTAVKRPIIAIDKSMLVLGLLSILVFISLIQTASLLKLVNGNSNPDSTLVKSVSQAKSASKTDSSGGDKSLPGVLKDIPQQVGGC